MFYWILFCFMPYPKRFSIFGMGFVMEYSSIYNSVKESATKALKKRLGEIDIDFQMQERGVKLVRLREEAHDKGIGPGDSAYPTFGDVK